MRRPDRFYKYRSLATDLERGRVADLITHSRLFYSAPAGFNDPFEFRYNLSFEGSPEQRRARIAAIIPKMKNAGTPDGDAQGAYLLNIVEQVPANEAAAILEPLVVDTFRTKTALYSVSAIPDDVLMWSHYSDSHKGVCLEFDANVDPPWLTAFPVSYSETIPTLNFYTDNEIERVRAVMLTKAQRWKYEAEWRCVDVNGGPGLRPFNPDSLTGVVFGLSCPQGTIDHVRGLVTGRGRAVELKRAALATGTYTLRLESL